jgi:hypothetical protein
MSDTSHVVTEDEGMFVDSDGNRLIPAPPETDTITCTGQRAGEYLGWQIYRGWAFGMPHTFRLGLRLTWATDGKRRLFAEDSASLLRAIDTEKEPF